MLKLIFKGLVYGFFGMVIYFIMKTLFAFSISFYIINNPYILEIANYIFNLYNDITLTVFVVTFAIVGATGVLRTKSLKKQGH